VADVNHVVMRFAFKLGRLGDGRRLSVCLGGRLRVCLGVRS
jgi:hypothetical protein